MNESLYANERKLKKLLTLALGRDVEEFIAIDRYAPEELILIRTSILKEISEEEFKKICEDAGYYCSIHYNDKGERIFRQYSMDRAHRFYVETEDPWDDAYESYIYD